MKTWLIVCSLGLMLIASACGPTLTIKHEVAPIYLTVDINIKVQKELEEFFDFEKTRDDKSGKIREEG